MTVDDLASRLHGANRPDAVWLPLADMNALLADLWERCPDPRTPGPAPKYERGKEYAIWGVPVGVLEVTL